MLVGKRLNRSGLSQNSIVATRDWAGPCEGNVTSQWCQSAQNSGVAVLALIHFPQGCLWVEIFLCLSGQVNSIPQMYCVMNNPISFSIFSDYKSNTCLLQIIWTIQQIIKNKFEITFNLATQKQPILIFLWVAFQIYVHR